MTKIDGKDPFTAGQMIGMLVMLTFIEENKGIPMDTLQHLKQLAAVSVEEYFEKPSEDIHLMIDKIVKEIKHL